MPQVERLYQCIICGAAWDSKQSLRAHLKKHKGEYMRTNIFVRPDNWRRFNKLCTEHKTTTCHVLDRVIEAMVQATDLKILDLGKLAAPNPIVINMSHVFLGKPRSKYKIDVSDLPALGKTCHVCGSRLISERLVDEGAFIEGECLRCGRRWLIEGPE